MAHVYGSLVGQYLASAWFHPLKSFTWSGCAIYYSAKKDEYALGYPLVSRPAHINKNLGFQTFPNPYLKKAVSHEVSPKQTSKNPTMDCGSLQPLCVLYFNAINRRCWSLFHGTSWPHPLFSSLHAACPGEPKVAQHDRRSITLM